MHDLIFVNNPIIGINNKLTKLMVVDFGDW